MMPTLRKQESFGIPFEVASDYRRGATVTTAFSDQAATEVPPDKPSCVQYLRALYELWRDMYKIAIENKKSFCDTYSGVFYSVFI